MATHSAITLNSPLFWIAIALTLLFIALLTYIYSGKNLKLTVLFTLLASLAVGCAAGYDSWIFYLNRHFLAGIDPFGVPFRASRSGWFLLIDAWLLWLVPAVLLGLLTGIGEWFVLHFLHKRSEPLEEIADIQPKRIGMGLSSEMVAQQLELDTLKKALVTANSRLKQTIYEKGIEEARSKELALKLKEHEQQGKSSLSASVDELKAAQIELDAKNKQLEALSQRTDEQQEEIARLKSLLEKLLDNK